jgi:tetratricopeptide (TPR) repeat protein
MAPKKKQYSVQPKQGFGTAKTAPISQLRKAEQLIQREKWDEAETFLRSLSQAYPQDPDPLISLLNLYYDLEDMQKYLGVAQKVAAMLPNDGDTAYVLGGAYLVNQHPLLALQTMRHAVERFPNHQKANDTRTTIAQFEPMVDELLADIGLTEATGCSREQGIALATLHERGQCYLHQGKYDLSKQDEEEVLRQQPSFVSARNNLSLISCLQGDLEGAIGQAQQVLEQEPDNIHALSNLIRFHILTGDFAQAQSFAEPLKTSQANAWDGWTKKIEGLSYLRDDVGVVALYEQAKAAGNLKEPLLNPRLLHLVAVAMAHLGQTNHAEKQWQATLKQFPNFDLAQGNLENLRKPIEQRYAAWPFKLDDWLTLSEIEDLRKVIAPTKTNSNQPPSSQLCQRYLAAHSRLTQIVPILLERGDPMSHEFAILLCQNAQTPELLESLKQFVLGQSGPDEVRYRAATTLVEAGLIDREKVRLWLKGKWQEIMLLNYQFHDDPSVGHSRPVEKLLRQAILLMQQNSVLEAEQAEALLLQALDKEPNAADVQNNLAAAYSIQGREAEAIALLHQIAKQHPDYLFAQVSIARLHIQAGELEIAEAMLKPFLSRRRFHFDEFAKFTDVHLLLLQAQGNLEGAKTWLQIWEQIDADNPLILPWKLRLKGNDALATLKKLMPSGKKSKK